MWLCGWRECNAGRRDGCWASSAGSTSLAAGRSPTDSAASAAAGSFTKRSRWLASNSSTTETSFAAGRRPVTIRHTHRARMLSAASAPTAEASTAGSSRTRPASARAASTNDGSFSITRAALGVLEIGRRAVHSSRVGASNAISHGCRNCRCQCTYTPRRYWPGPWDGLYLRSG